MTVRQCVPQGTAQDEHDHRQRRADGRLEGDACQGDGCRGVDDADHQPQRHPGRCRRHRSDDEWRTDSDQQTAEQRDHARGHRRRDERNHREVDERRDHRESTERREDHGQCCRLGGQRDAEALGEPARDASAADPLEAVGERRRPRDQPGRGQRRELETCVADQPGIDDEQDRGGPAEGRGRPTGAPALAGDQDDAGHRSGPQHGGAGAGERDVDDDREGGDERPTPPGQAAGDRRHGSGHDRDIPAGDRDDVAHPGGRERGRHVPVHPVAEADEDAGRQTRLRLREDRRQRVPGTAPDALKPPAGVIGGRDDAEGARVDRAPRAEPLEIPPVVRVRARSSRPAMTTTSVGSIGG